jgi:SAM-dependent methyltransferase
VDVAGLASTPEPSDEQARWTASLAGEGSQRLVETLETLPLEALGRYPPPRNGGFPFGRELRVLRRRLKDESVQLYPSAFSSAYAALAPRRHRQLFQAFTLGHPKGRDEWCEILGEEAVEDWREQGLLLGDAAVLRPAFRIVVFAGLRLLVDAFAHQARFANRVHVGLDTMILLEAASGVATRRGRRLDVGTGSGALLLALQEPDAEAVGVDINPRAVDVARFNARLNRRECRFLRADVFEMDSIGRFEFVTWNLPFHFMPADERGDNVDGDGGEMGIELTLRFVDGLPDLLTDSGSAHLLTSSPRLTDGTDLLTTTLARRAPALRLDIRVRALHALWSPSRRRFHLSHGIRRFENVLVEIRRGSGLVERNPAPLAQRAMDWVRAVRHGDYAR